MILRVSLKCFSDVALYILYLVFWLFPRPDIFFVNVQACMCLDARLCDKCRFDSIRQHLNYQKEDNIHIEHSTDNNQIN